MIAESRQHKGIVDVLTELLAGVTRSLAGHQNKEKFEVACTMQL